MLAPWVMDEVKTAKLNDKDPRRNKLTNCAPGVPGVDGHRREALVGEPPELCALWAHFVRPQPPDASLCPSWGH
jgi:hypothetical protein